VLKINDFMISIFSCRKRSIKTYHWIVVTHNQIKVSEISTIIGQKFTNISTLSNYPCDSGNLGIYVVTGLSALQMWPVSLIKNKAFQMDFGNDHTFPISFIT